VSHVFVSYSRRNKPFAERLAAALAERQPVDLGDSPERFRRNDAGVALDQLVELPACMGQAT